jgi:hypothetical protein
VYYQAELGEAPIRTADIYAAARKRMTIKTLAGSSQTAANRH